MIVRGGARLFTLLERDLCYRRGTGLYGRYALLDVLPRYQARVGKGDDFEG